MFVSKRKYDELSSRVLCLEVDLSRAYCIIDEMRQKLDMDITVDMIDDFAKPQKMLEMMLYQSDINRKKGEK